jgi:uncharacterized membrane protein
MQFWLSVALAFHIVSVVVWVGGMFFAYMSLRPVAADLFQPPERLTLWAQVLKKFFIWVWHAIAFLWISGLWIIIGYYGGMKAVGIHVHSMLGLAMLMTLLFLYVYIRPYAGLKKAVAAQDWATGGQHLGMIRRIVGLNTLLGLITAVVGTSGKFW